ncbi:hypothetical protein FPV67DRAFT_1451641 [Lyophyllum atratum]|nr:hypothetical protein FPV67DRAFT_1451641 [Lyophyllum atratum]
MLDVGVMVDKLEWAVELGRVELGLGCEAGAESTRSGKIGTLIIRELSGFLDLRRAFFRERKKGRRRGAWKKDPNAETERVTAIGQDTVDRQYDRAVEFAATTTDVWFQSNRSGHCSQRCGKGWDGVDVGRRGPCQTNALMSFLFCTSTTPGPNKKPQKMLYYEIREGCGFYHVVQEYQHARGDLSGTGRDSVDGGGVVARNGGAAWCLNSHLVRTLGPHRNAVLNPRSWDVDSTSNPLHRPPAAMPAPSYTQPPLLPPPFFRLIIAHENIKDAGEHIKARPILGTPRRTNLTLLPLHSLRFPSSTLREVGLGKEDGWEVVTGYRSTNASALRSVWHTTSSSRWTDAGTTRYDVLVGVSLVIHGRGERMRILATLDFLRDGVVTRAWRGGKTRLGVADVSAEILATIPRILTFGIHPSVKSFLRSFRMGGELTSLRLSPLDLLLKVQHVHGFWTTLLHLPKMWRHTVTVPGDCVMTNWDSHSRKWGVGFVGLVRGDSGD